MLPRHLPHDIAYLHARLDPPRHRARDRGSITLEWMVISALLFLAAIWAATRVVSAIHHHAGQIH